MENMIIIEVKTTWIEAEGQYTRDIIEYRYDKNISIPKPIYSILNLQEEKIKQEYTNSYTKNTIEINVKDCQNNTYKETLNEIESMLYNYVKNQWRHF
jgi:hypothetical protein